MSCPKSWGDTTSTIFSPALGGGPTLSDWPDGRTTGRSGPGHVPVNLSARQAGDLGLLTSGTCGLLGTGSSSSAALQRFLASRLAGLAGLSGSILYSAIWKPWITPAGRRCCQLAASGHRTCGSAFSGWPTPTARDYRSDRSQKSSSELYGTKGQPLARVVLYAISGWDATGSTSPMAPFGLLNPEHTRWLMGFPPGWSNCADMGTLLCRKSRRNLSRQ